MGIFEISKSTKIDSSKVGQLMAIQLEMRNILVQFKQRRLFHIPTLSLGSQDMVYLSGQNGTGKTTLLKIIAGLLRPTQGQINLPKPSLLQRWAGFEGQARILYMHQSPYLFDANVESNILYALKAQKLTQQDKRQRLIKALKLVELDKHGHQHVSLLSSGEKQKVALARAWAYNPAILLMDESSANLDTQATQIEKSIVKQLVHQGAGVVVTSHQTNALTSCCTQQWIIDNQRLIHIPDKLEAIKKQRGS
jgi:tungstate transport system ATP-binding protein